MVGWLTYSDYKGLWRTRLWLIELCWHFLEGTEENLEQSLRIIFVLGEIRINLWNTSLQHYRLTNLLCLSIIIIIIIIINIIIITIIMAEIVVCLNFKVYFSACFFSVTSCLSVRWPITHIHTRTLRRVTAPTDLAARGDLSYRCGGVPALCQMNKILNKPEIQEQFRMVWTWLLILKFNLLFIEVIVTSCMTFTVRIFDSH